MTLAYIRSNLFRRTLLVVLFVPVVAAYALVQAAARLPEVWDGFCDWFLEIWNFAVRDAASCRRGDEVAR